MSALRLFQLTWFLLLLGAETAIPYRPPLWPRWYPRLSNLTLALANFLLIGLAYGTVNLDIHRHAAENMIGLLNRLALSGGWRMVLAILLLDFATYLWHRANHLIPLLWRVHRVHHSDLDMDVTTAGRFHVVELALWSVIKLGLILILGLRMEEILFFETLLVLTTQFQHSALNVPAALEKALEPLTFSPSHHRIHHSVIIRERNSNYGNILSVWDRLFGSLHPWADSKAITLGVGGHPYPANLPTLLKMPFVKAVR